jgi:hypothetical protein
MIHYYINPKTHDLLVYDPTAGELLILERVEKIKVVSGGDIEDAPRKSYLDDDDDTPPEPWKCPEPNCTFQSTGGYAIGNHKRQTGHSE